MYLGFRGCSDIRESACSAGDLGSIPGSGRFLGEGNGNPLQYPGLKNSMDRGARPAAVHGVAKSQTWLRNPNPHPHTQSSCTYSLNSFVLRKTCLVFLFPSFTLNYIALALLKCSKDRLLQKLVWLEMCNILTLLKPRRIRRYKTILWSYRTIELGDEQRRPGPKSETLSRIWVSTKLWLWAVPLTALKLFP